MGCTVNTTTLALFFILVCLFTRANATPAHKAALDQHYDRFLTPSLNHCTTCHRPSPLKEPQSLSEFPHNAFGDRLKRAAAELSQAGKPKALAARLILVGTEDSDGDGTANQAEILLGHNPGDPLDKPNHQELASASRRESEFRQFLSSYRWRPFESITQPKIPATAPHPVDAFLSRARSEQKLSVQKTAPKLILLRRLYQDLIGLNPTPSEQQAFLDNSSIDAYEKVVDRLLADPRHGERWGRHWMDVWRYSDWAGWADGNQVRDSKPHIWRWRDWIIESLNQDKGYHRMLAEMLAGDEIAPLDSNTLRATGFLVRNYKMLSREQWMEDTVKHTFQAFLGVTVGCAKCHDHMTDPISQLDYYRVRSIFDPHHVRTDALPGQADPAKDGLVRAYDLNTNRVTYVLKRGDERHPETNRVAEPGVPAALTGSTSLAPREGRFHTSDLPLPSEAAKPHHRESVRRDLLTAAAAATLQKRKALEAAKPTANPGRLQGLELEVLLEQSRQAALSDLLALERFEEKNGRNSGLWESLARQTVASQRQSALLEAQWDQRRKLDSVSEAKTKFEAANPLDAKTSNTLATARKNLEEAEKQLLAAKREMEKPLSTEFKPRAAETFPASSSGRRLRLAEWIADPKNPLTARVAVNHVWLRHFGRGLAPNPANFGRLGGTPDHPELFDWLAAEFVAREWSLKWLHRLLVTSETYRLNSTPDEPNLAIDPDNRFYWRMMPRRLEAEAVRDSLLHASGSIQQTMGGPEIDHQLGLKSTRRSVYLRIAPEKEVEFLKLFDGPSVTECYERRPSIMPQQALALGNSSMAIEQARLLATRLSREHRGDESFVQQAYARILGRPPGPEELRLCREFLDRPPQTQAGNPARPRENLVLVLFNHHEAVTVR